MIAKSFLRALPALALCCAAAASFAADGDAPADATAPPGPTAMTTPTMSYPLTANPKPASFDFGPLGTAYVTGMLTGLAYAQSNEVPGDRSSRADLSNGQVVVQTTDGVVQYYIQAGGYSLPALGAPYFTASDTVDAYYGLVPTAFLKFVPNAAFSLQIGKLPTLIGAEYTFTFQNTNIERGLLWNQESAISRGAQANYTNGPAAVSVAWTDGFYSNRYSWLSGSLAWTFDPSNILGFVYGSNTDHTTHVSSATPLLQNNSQILNIIYTHIAGALTLEPYVQYTRVPKAAEIGTLHSASTWGAALLANYAFDPQFSLAGRVEYIDSSGSATDGTPNLLYGPGSNAWSFTLTPTWQIERFFARLDLSYVKAGSETPGLAFGDSGTKTSQSRAMVEAGLLF